MQIAGFGQPFAQQFEIHVTESLSRPERQFECSAFQMIDQNFQIVRLDVGMLGRAGEKILRMLDDKLIQGTRRSDQHGAGTPFAPPRPPGALPGRGDRAGISGHDRHVQRSDVDAEFERIGRDHGPDLAAAQAALDLPPLQRKIPAAIAFHYFRRAGRLRIILLQIREQHFGMQPAVGENNRLKPALQKLPGDAPRLIDIAAANAQKLVHDRRIVEDKIFFGRRRAVPVEHFHIGTDQPSGKLPGIGDRRRRKNELRLPAVKPGDAPEPAQHVRQMTAENPAVRVQLVDDDVLQIFEKARPFRVVRQYARVQHVGIGENDMPVLPDRLPRIGGRIAVIGEYSEWIAQPAPQVLQFGQLVLSQRFGGENVKRAGIGILQHGIQDGKVVAERFAGRRRGHNHRVVAAMHPLRRFRLMRVELLDALWRGRLAPVPAGPIRASAPIELPARESDEPP